MRTPTDWVAIVFVAGGLAYGPVFPEVAGDPLQFVDIAASAGLSTPTWCGRPDKPHILESNGTGLGLIDFDRDGDLDLYLVNGWRLQGNTVVEHGRDALFRNDGGGIFAEVTEEAGLGSDAWGSGIAAGDIDGDGWIDLFITNFGTDTLYRNRGDGSFEKIENGPSLEGWSAGAVLFDADGDGDEDLFVGGYIDCTLEEVLEAEPTLDWEGLKVMKGPFGLEGLANRFFENRGAGEFVEATEAAGLEDSGLFYTFGVLAVDLDGDLDLDIYAANDSNPNYVYQNDGKGRFQEVGLWSGAALDAMGNAQAGMGLAAADLESDGLVDLFVTNFQKDASTLYRNLGDFVFEDVTRSVRVGEPTFARLSWGATLSDFDHDLDLDLFVANGHIYPQADLIPEISGGFGQKNLLLRNIDGVFVDVSEESGSGLEIALVSHGLAVGDIDADGDLDLAISNIDMPPTLLRNDSRNKGAWSIVDQKDAVRVAVTSADSTLLRHRVHGGSFLSVNDSRHHFGLADAEIIDSLEIDFADGSKRRLERVPVNRVIVIAR
ncbi:MAG: CRTAC1 family protein [Acidobacteriota bacterium]